MTQTLAGPRGGWVPGGAGEPRVPVASSAPSAPSAPPAPPAPAPAVASSERETLARWRSVSLIVAVLALMVLFAVSQGGYQPVVWLGGALAAVALWLWARLTFGAAPALGAAGRGALLALILYLAWSYASVSWAADPGAALSGSDRTLLYLVLFALGAGVHWTSRRLELALAAYAIALGAIAALTLAALARHLDPGALQAGALASPLGYHNATAALGTVGALSAILLCGSRELAVPVRGALAAAATACLEMSLLADSRGWLYTLPVILVAVLALTPRRGRVCAWALVPVAATLATLPWILRLYAPSGALYGAASERASAALDIDCARAALLAVLLSGLLTAGLAWAERSWRLAAPVRRTGRRLAAGALALALLSAAAGGGLLLADGALARAVRQFTSDSSVRPGVVRFAQLGGDRYDFWRVGWRSFLAHPLGGLGQDNFAQAYTAARRSLEEPTWVHSLELRLLSGTGIVGLLLFAGFTVLALTAARRGARAGGTRRRALIAVALVPEAVWLIHGSFDWFWEIPALAAPAFWWLGAAVAGEGARRPAALPHAWSRLSRARSLPVGGRSRLPRGAPAPGAVLATGAATLALLVLGSAYLGQRALAQASALAGAAPRRALVELRQARALLPLDYTPLALAGAIELRLGEPLAAEADVAAGLARDRTSWLLWLERGLADGAAGRRRAELAALAQARALDPREPVIALAQNLARSGRTLTIERATHLFAVREREVVGA
jgi:hypothetical protein